MTSPGSPSTASDARAFTESRERLLHDQVLGYPLSTVRDLLKLWSYAQSRSIWILAQRTKIDPRIIALLLDHAHLNGLLIEGAIRPRLSEEGQALIEASARKPLPRDRASARLEMLIAQCDRINARPEFPYRISEVWLFGDMLDPTIKAVTSLNLAVRWVTSPGLTREEALARAILAASKLHLVPDGYRPPEESLPGRLRDYILYEGGKPAFITESSIGYLADRACPCRCLYADERGGVVHDPILPQHPDSIEHNRVGYPSKPIPDLPPAGLSQPVSAHLFNERDSGRFRYETYGPWGALDPRYLSLRHQPNFESVFLDRTLKKDGLATNAVTRRLNLRRCDGRIRTAFVCGHLDLKRSYPDRSIPPIRPNASLILERRIVKMKDRIQYRIRILKTDRLGALTRGDSDVLLMVWWIHTLAVADIEGVRHAAKARGDARPLQLHWTVLGSTPLDEKLKTELKATPHLGCLRIPNPKI